MNPQSQNPTDLPFITNHGGPDYLIKNQPTHLFIMQTQTSSQRQATVVLKDGIMTLGTWTQPLDHLPSLGETIALPVELEGYEPQGVVALIQVQGHEPVKIQIDANCKVASDVRPRIVLNADRIAETRREAVESHLRNALKCPFITWEPSTHPDPVLRYHDPATGQKSLPRQLQSSLVDMIQETVLM